MFKKIEKRWARASRNESEIRVWTLKSLVIGKTKENRDKNQRAKLITGAQKGGLAGMVMLMLMLMPMEDTKLLLFNFFLKH